MKLGTDPIRLPYLDSLRGLAAYAVVAFHYNLGFGYPKSLPDEPQLVLAALCDGFAAVSIFFVLSGFVLSLKLFKHPKT